MQSSDRQLESQNSLDISSVSSFAMAENEEPYQLQLQNNIPINKFTLKKVPEDMNEVLQMRNSHDINNNYDINRNTNKFKLSDKPLENLKKAFSKVKMQMPDQPVVDMNAYLDRNILPQ